MKRLAAIALMMGMATSGVAEAGGKSQQKSSHRPSHKPSHKGGKRQAKEAIYAGEMPQPNAHTLRKGQGQIDLLTRSHWGLTNDLQLDVTMARFLLVGPNAGLEYAFLQNKKQAVSLQAYGQTNWRRYSQRATLLPMYTWGGHRSNRLNTGLGVELRKWDWSRVPQDRIRSLGFSGRDDTVRTIGVPFHLGYDYVLGNRNVFQFWGSTDLAAPGQDQPFRFQLGSSWNHGWHTLRLSLGLTVNYNALADMQEVFDALEDTIPAFDRDLPRFLVLPYARLWWRF